MRELKLNPRSPQYEEEKIKRETNTEFLTRVMEFAKTGPLMQAFILDSLTKVANTVAALSEDELVARFGDNSPVDPAAWHACAKELKAELDKKYGG